MFYAEGAEGCIDAASSAAFTASAPSARHSDTATGTGGDNSGPYICTC